MACVHRDAPDPRKRRAAILTVLRELLAAIAWSAVAVGIDADGDDDGDRDYVAVTGGGGHR